MRSLTKWHSYATISSRYKKSQTTLIKLQSEHVQSLLKQFQKLIPNKALEQGCLKKEQLEPDGRKVEVIQEENKEVPN